MRYYDRMGELEAKMNADYEKLQSKLKEKGFVDPIEITSLKAASQKSQDDAVVFFVKFKAKGVDAFETMPEEFDA